jgi:hypothetical protein
MEQEIDILIQYGEADMNKRLHLFLQFPDLRRGFQQIEHKELAPQSESISFREEHIKGKCARSLSLLVGAYRRSMKIKMLKNFLKPLRPSGRGTRLRSNSEPKLL